MAQSLAQRRRSGDLPALKIEIWHAILTAVEIMNAPDSSPELRLRAVHATAQAGTLYMNMLRESEVEARMAAIERRLGLRALRNGHGVA